MAKKNQGGQNKKKVFDQKKTKKEVKSINKIPVVDDHIHPYFRGMDE